VGASTRFNLQMWRFDQQKKGDDLNRNSWDVANGDINQ